MIHRMGTVVSERGFEIDGGIRHRPPDGSLLNIINLLELRFLI
jgi:hypothetical protein